jgi:hypothetical protein
VKGRRITTRINVPIRKGQVWLTISDVDGTDALIHGVFTTKTLEEQCARILRKWYKERNVSVGGWTINQPLTISD